jgi:hypothetical protein
MAEKEKKEPAPKKPMRVTRAQLVMPAGLEARYSNLVRISHTPSEMIFDFGQILPGDKRASIKSRILMTPISAKLLQRALTENLGKFEASFGEIKIPEGKTLADNLFGPLKNNENSDEPEKEE